MVIDPDVFALKDVSFMFDLLDGHDLACTFIGEKQELK